VQAPADDQGRGDPREARARRGLEAWAGFPADRRPRPLILLSSAVRPGSFPDGQTKLAFHNGLIEAVPDFPAPVLQALRGRPRAWAGTPLLLTSATPDETEFVTDRGRQSLPAWCVRARDVPEPIWVLDPATSLRCWQPPGQEPGSWRHQEATLGADGCTLTMSFLGSPPDYTSYSGARVLESGNAVALIPHRTELVTGVRTAVAMMRQVTANLDRPLGNRVLLDDTGSPVMARSV
jgi:hypothetical protein